MEEIKKPIHARITGKLVNVKGKPLDPSDIGDCLSELNFIQSIALQRPTSSYPLMIYLFIKESNQGGKREIGSLVHSKIGSIGLAGSYEVYGLPMFPLLDDDSGSIDWSRLSQIQSYRLTKEKVNNGTTTLEKAIISSWSKYLNIPAESIDLNDNLFELGSNLFLAGRIGHSLYVQNYPVTIEMIINNPTVRGLVDAIESSKSTNQSNGPNNSIARIDCDPNERKSLLSWTQRWVYIHEQLLGKGYYYYLDISYGIDPELDYATIESAINQLIDSVELLRSFVRTRGSTHYLTIAPTRRLSIPVIKVADDKEAREKIDEKRETFNIVGGDETFLFDVIFIETPEVNCFTLFIHHLIVDDYSYLLLEEKFFQLLQSIQSSSGGPKPVRDKSSIDYVDYTVWVTREIQRKSEIVDPLEEYWLNRMSNLPNCLIPVNFDENNLPKEPKVSGKHSLITLTEEETNGARRLARSVGTTLDILTEAVVKATLYKLTGVNDTVIKRIVSARLHPVSYEMIGHFNNMIYSRTVIKSMGETFTSVLKDFHSTWLTDFNYRGHPWINTVASTNVEHICPAGISIIGLPEQRFVDDDRLPVKIFQVNQFTQVSFELVTCIFGLHEGKLHYCLNYNEDLLEPEVIDSLVNTFEILLRRVVTYSDRSIDDYFNIEPKYDVTQWPQEVKRSDDSDLK